jgi:hypothetical protein
MSDLYGLRGMGKRAQVYNGSEANLSCSPFLMRFHLLPALTLLPLLTQCTKDEPGPAKPEDQLPPITQTGRMSFGCLINGQPFRPTPIFLKTTYLLNYDPTYGGGSLLMKVQKYTGKAPIISQFLTIATGNITKVGTYPFSLGQITSVDYTDDSKKIACQEYGNRKTATYLGGQLVITRLDVKEGIFSGTFAFKLAQPGCDTLRITHGRFDSSF